MFVLLLFALGLVLGLVLSPWWFIAAGVALLIALLAEVL